MNHRLLMAFLGCVLIGGCATVEPYHYYRLEAHAPQADTRLNASLGVAPVALPEWMDSPVLTWSDGTYLVHRSDLSRWGGELGTMVEQALRRNLMRQTGGERISLGPWFGEQRPEYVLVLEIENLIRSGNAISLEASWSIEDQQRKATYQSSAYIREVFVDENLAPGEFVAKGLSQLLGDLSNDIVTQLHTPQY